MKPPKVWRHSYNCAFCRKKSGTPPYDPPWTYRYQEQWFEDPKQRSWYQRLFSDVPKYIWGGYFYHIACKKAHEVAQRLLR